MGFKKDLLLATGALALLAGFITTTPINMDNLNSLSIEESFKSFQQDPERVSSTSGSVVSQAKEIVKSECNPDIWSNWSNLTAEEKEGKVGLAKGLERSLFNNSTLKIELHIDDTLTDSNEIIATAWHECGHAKTYNLPSDKVDEVYKDMMTNFSECVGYEDECMADAMSQFKTGKPLVNGYLLEANPEQLKVAEKVWNYSDEVSFLNKREAGSSWIQVVE